MWYTSFALFWFRKNLTSSNIFWTMIENTYVLWARKMTTYFFPLYEILKSSEITREWFVDIKRACGRRLFHDVARARTTKKNLRKSVSIIRMTLQDSLQFSVVLNGFLTYSVCVSEDRSYFVSIFEISSSSVNTCKSLHDDRRFWTDCSIERIRRVINMIG